MLPEIKRDNIQSRASIEHASNIPKCTHGFGTAGNKISKIMFDYVQCLCDHELVKVYKAKCIESRKCYVAIKQVNLLHPVSRNRYEKESKAYEILKSGNHKNIVEFFGSFVDSDYGFIVMELADKNLGDILEKTKTLSSENIEELAYQLFQILKQMGDAGIIADDFGVNNIVYFEKDGLIKLIDFEQCFKKEDKEYEEQYTHVLRYISLKLFSLQLLLKYDCNESESKKDEEYFFSNHLKSSSDVFNEKSVEKMISDPRVWHKGTSDILRKVIAYSLVNNQPAALLHTHLFSLVDLLRHTSGIRISS